MSCINFSTLKLSIENNSSALSANVQVQIKTLKYWSNNYIRVV
jgi:hypothetical protein